MSRLFRSGKILLQELNDAIILVINLIIFFRVTRIVNIHINIVFYFYYEC